MIHAVDRRLESVDKVEFGIRTGYQEGIDLLYANFREFKREFHGRTAKFTNKQWRRIKRDLKDFGRIPLDNLDTLESWDEACAELAAFGNQKRFVF